MARNRQRAKQRQAERRAARAGEGPAAGNGAGAPDAAVPRAAPDAAQEAGAELAASAPPEEVGRTDAVLGPSPDAVPPEALPEVEPDEELSLDGAGQAEEEEALPEAERRAGAEAPPERNRVAAFLTAVWAELKRVQWPNRSQLTTLTGIVLGFVLIAGGYLGLLDAIFSRLIQAIL